MENDGLLQYYLGLEDIGDAHIDIRDNAIIIRQPIDDEEDSKYVALREECSKHIWETFTLVFDKWEVLS